MKDIMESLGKSKKVAIAAPDTSGAPKKTARIGGVQRAAVLMLALGSQYGEKVWALLDEDEIRDLSLTIAKLGPVAPDMVEELVVDFVSRMSSAGALMGGFDSTERLLKKFIPGDRVNTIMEEIRGPAGRNMWEKLSNIQESVLANYLKNEYPQTVALILSKIRPEHAARVLSNFTDDFAMEVIDRMLKMEAVQKEILERVEQTLRTEFMANLSQTQRRDSHEMMAEIFNNFDRQTETKFIGALEDVNRDSAEKIKALMFTFEDLLKIDNAGIQVLLRNVEKDKLSIALKGASEAVREFFFSNMSGRAANNLKDDMQALGPVRLRDVDDAQTSMVNIAKDLAAKGELVIAKSGGDDDVIV